MSKRFGVSGACAEAIVAAATDARYLLGKAISTNRSFWLKAMWVYNSHATADAILDLFDSAEGANPAAATQKFSLVCPPGVTTVMDFGSPGLEFKTNCVAAQAGGTVLAFEAGGNGYEVG